MCKFYKNFFSNDSVKFNQPFPKSCFSNLEFDNCIEFPYLVKGKDRHYCFMPKKYNFFMTNVGMDKFIKTISAYPYKQNRTNLISFTDIYNKVDAKISKKTYRTYCHLMISKWAQYKECIKEYGEQFSCVCYFDLENFYSSLYIHWILGLYSSNINDFRKIKKMSNDERKHFLSTNHKQLWDFHINFMENISFCKETKGIPIGNGISDFFAEELIQLSEYFLSKEINLQNIRIVRFRDDIWLFGDNISKIEKIFYKFKSILLEFKLFVNSKTVFANTFADKYSLISEKIYEKEEMFVNKIMKHDILFGLPTYSMVFPKSNKIFKWLSKLYDNVNSLSAQSITNTMVKVFEYSKTCVIPWIVAIIDKINDSNKNNLITYFLNNINLYKLSISDIIWLYCLSRKYNIENREFEEIISKLDDDIKNLLDGADRIQDSNFREDADTFFYE